MTAPIEQKYAYPNPTQQNFIAYDRGDMFIPAGFVHTPIEVAIRATPHIGYMPVHSVPVTYQGVAQSTVTMPQQVAVITPVLGAPVKGGVTLL